MLHLIGPRPLLEEPTFSTINNLMLSEPSSGTYEYPDFRFIATIHAVLPKKNY
jgi:hypothetical protein